MAKVLALGFDLFFKPKMMQAAQAAGVEVVFPAAAEVVQRAADADRVVADVSAPGVLNLVASVRALRPDLPVVACYPHVQEDLAKEARALGAVTVTRGHLNANLEAALAGKL